MKVVKMDEIAKEVLINPVFTGREVTRQPLLPESKESEKGCGINSMLTILNRS
jgi:hypothetical protein